MLKLTVDSKSKNVGCYYIHIRTPIFSYSHVHLLASMAPSKNLLASVASILYTLIVCLPVVSTATFTFSGSTVELNNVPYYIPPVPISTIDVSYSDLQRCASVNGLVPLTVIWTSSRKLSQNDFAQTISNFLQTDDVFSIGFLEGIASFSLFAMRLLSL